MITLSIIALVTLGLAALLNLFMLLAGDEGFKTIGFLNLVPITLAIIALAVWMGS